MLILYPIYYPRLYIGPVWILTWLDNCRYNQSASTSAKSLDLSDEVSLVSGAFSGTVIKENCDMKTSNGSSWNYPNQTSRSSSHTTHHGLAPTSDIVYSRCRQPTELELRLRSRSVRNHRLGHQPHLDTYHGKRLYGWIQRHDFWRVAAAQSGPGCLPVRHEPQSAGAHTDECVESGHRFPYIDECGHAPLAAARLERVQHSADRVQKRGEQLVGDLCERQST